MGVMVSIVSVVLITSIGLEMVTFCELSGLELLEIVEIFAKCGVANCFGTESVKPRDADSLTRFFVRV